MSNRPTDEQMIKAFQEYGGKVQAERHLRSLGFEVSEASIRRALARTDRTPGADFEVEVPEIEDVEELISRRIKQFESKRKFELATKTLPVNVRLDGPIGIAFVGDPHVDDDGTDLKTLFEHADLLDGRNEGLFGVCLGDIWNNWQGRLSRLWAEQSTSSEEAKALARAFLNRVRWLAVVWGNHDLWGKSEDLLSEMMTHQPGVQKSSRLKLALRFPNSDRVLKIAAAHKFPGSSQWSPVFGVSKRAQLDGYNHIYVGGDKHISGYTHGWHEGGEIMWHAVQVGSYKIMDRYATDLNLVDKHIYNCPVALIDPNATDELNFVRWEFDPHEGAERLKWMRKRWADR